VITIHIWVIDDDDRNESISENCSKKPREVTAASSVIQRNVDDVLLAATRLCTSGDRMKRDSCWHKSKKKR
jgi:hypothetical protein